MYSFEYINENWDKNEIGIFKNISENDTTPRDYHFGIGLHLRNNLLRHNRESDSIVKFFNDLDISHYDYMSGIILTSYHRYLNEENIKLKEQVDGIIKMLKPTKETLECLEKQKNKRLKIYNGHKVNDTVNIKMPVGDNYSVVNYSCPNLDWDFNPSKDLSVNGIITNKYFVQDSLDLFLTIKILTKNHTHIEIYLEEVNVGDEFEVSLYETAWKIKTNGNNTYN